MPDTQMDAGGMAGWIGRQEVLEDEVALPIIRRMAALLDQDPLAYRRGDALPEGWHSVFFAPIARQSQLGPDGHPKKGDFLPPVPLPRRMFAGRRLRYLVPITIGAEIRRTSTIGAITPKTGRTGEMIFVRVDHVVEMDGKPVLTEVQDIVYREEAKPGAGAPPKAEAPVELPAPDETQVYAPETTHLFRYSALTYNGHRIHYDQPYTTQEEGYPGLVVNGGLHALFLHEMARRNLPGGRLGCFSVRNVNPFFVNRVGELRCKREEDGSLRLWALNEQGKIVAQAEAAAEPGEMV
ncbi:FAS1-like dehydratase domain-containing protein [Falsiroseomonas tokyonensis]|uniref:MaoC family dehydratase N-terminal domain-containing protein n=1 Tax=Falsiroseomonas tokyonensis TaxID=430521 RepID=A0ABV7C134_9PROT|nr:MaoC family dehydratase N-terminal domain-containing protein [Falsiroseomonas tokyonensis]MBU8540365.1 MaoC family dehydratase N-terminal domain-containing protein [Falsiroseomonas tokyonensis]